MQVKLSDSEQRIVIDDIDMLFEFYRLMIRDKKNGNTKTESLFSLVIDCYGALALLNFVNSFGEEIKNKETIRFEDILVQVFSIIVNESIVYLDMGNILGASMQTEGSYIKSIFEIRKDIHQFRKANFHKKIEELDISLERSRDYANPALDLAFNFEIMDGIERLIGTNQFQHINVDAKSRLVVETMQIFLREIEKSVSLKPCGNLIKIIDIKPKYKWESVSYVSIIRKSKVLEEREIDRLLRALDVVAATYEMFEYVIDIDDYLIKTPYLVYFFRKIISIFLDETIDNINNFIKYSDDISKVRIFEKILDGVDEGIIEKCRVLRNNLHYESQVEIEIGDAKQSYDELIWLININMTIMRNISETIEYRPRKITRIMNRVIRWAGS